MINTEIIKNILETKLNQNVEIPYSLYAEVVNQRDNKVSSIQGILRQVNVDFSPTPGITDMYLNYRLMFTVPIPDGNRNLIKITTDLNTKLIELNGYVEQLSENETLIFNISLIPTVYDNRPNALTSTSALLQCIIRVRYLKDVIATNQLILKLNGEVIPYYLANIDSTRMGRIQTQLGDSQSYYRVHSRTKNYNLTLPYKKNSILGKVYEDLIKNDLNELYLLEYYDNERILEDNPISEKVLLADTSRIILDHTQGIKMIVNFKVTDPNS